MLVRQFAAPTLSCLRYPMLISSPPSRWHPAAPLEQPPIQVFGQPYFTIVRARHATDAPRAFRSTLDVRTWPGRVRVRHASRRPRCQRALRSPRARFIGGSRSDRARRNPLRHVRVPEIPTHVGGKTRFSVDYLL